MIGGLIIFVLSFILIALVSGNNMPVCSGSLVGGRILSKRSGIMLTMFGYLAGLYWREAC